MSAEFPTFANSGLLEKFRSRARQSPLPLLLLWWGTILGGCSMYRSGFNNLVVAPLQFQLHKDRCSTDRYHRQLARNALQVSRADNSRAEIDPDYAAGFEQGFVEYLTNGGDPLPPLLPPRGYWKLGNRTGTRQNAAQKWLSGATDGRANAAESCLRNSAVIPSTIPMSEFEPVIWESKVPEKLPQVFEDPS